MKKTKKSKKIVNNVWWYAGTGTQPGPVYWTGSTTSAPGFDDHQAFSMDEVKAVLRFFNLPEKDYWEWMDGQTCPMLPNGKLAVYWYDLHRYVTWKEKGIVPVWD